MKLIVGHGKVLCVSDSLLAVSPVQQPLNTCHKFDTFITGGDKCGSSQKERGTTVMIM